MSLSEECTICICYLCCACAIWVPFCSVEKLRLPLTCTCDAGEGFLCGSQSGLFQQCIHGQWPLSSNEAFRAGLDNFKPSTGNCSTISHMQKGCVLYGRVLQELLTQKGWTVPGFVPSIWTWILSFQMLRQTFQMKSNLYWIQEPKGMFCYSPCSVHRFLISTELLMW